MATTQDLDEVLIKELNLSPRVIHTLSRSGVFTVGKLKKLAQSKKLEQINNIGQKSLDEISMALNDLYKNTSEYIKVEKNSNSFIGLFGDVVREDINSAPVGILDLRMFIKRSFIKNGIITIGDLNKMSCSDILDINHIGPKLLEEIRQSLIAFYANPDKYLVQQEFELEDEKENINRTQIEQFQFESEKGKGNWSEIVQSYFENEKDTYTLILLSRYGVKSKTLEEIASELGITRERVRQIEGAVAIHFLNYLRLAKGATELLGKVSGILSFYGEDLSLKKFREMLKKEKIIGEFSSSFVSERISKLDPFETLICWLSLLSNLKYSLEPMVFPVDINALIHSKNISINDLEILENISSKTRRKIKRKVYFTGGINIKDTIAILSVNERIAELVLSGLNLRKLENSWYSLKTFDVEVDGEIIPLRLAGLKMLSIASEIDFTVFCDGLRRYVNRFYAMLAPADVLMYFLSLIGFEVNDHQRVSTRHSVNNVLSKSEKSLISAIAKNEGVANFFEIAEEFFLQKLSLPAVSVTLKRSPIVEKIDEGLYKLRGVDISWQQIEAAKKRQKRFSQDDEIVHGLDGIIRMKLTVNSYTFLTGVVQAYSVRELSGLWSVVHDGKSFGDAKIDESYLWGLSKIFKELDVQMGDRVELAFNTWNRTLSVEKVNHGNS
jgi:hypothetical protein